MTTEYLKIIAPSSSSSCSGTQQFIYAPQPIPSPSSSGVTHPSFPIAHPLAGNPQQLLPDLVQLRVCYCFSSSPEENFWECKLPSFSSQGGWRWYRQSQGCAHLPICPFSVWVVLSLRSAGGRQVKPWRPKLFEAFKGFRDSAAPAMLRQDQHPVGVMSKLFPSQLPGSGCLVTAVQATSVTAP